MPESLTVIRWRVPKRRDGLKTFNHIIEIARELFAKNSFSQTSINQIIDTSGIAAGTFYSYFDDKLAVYQYLLKEYSRKIKSTTRKATEKCDSREEKERLGLKAFIMFTLADPLSFKIIWESMLIDWDTFKNYYSSFATSYIASLKESQAKKEISADTNLETLSYILMGVNNFVGMQILFKDSITEDEVDKIVDNAISMLKNGFLK